MTDTADNAPINWQQNAHIAVPSAQTERRLAIRVVDWNRLKRAMQQIQKPLPSISFVYSALVGVAASAGATIVPLQFSTGLPAWVIPLYVCLTAFSAIVAVVLYFMEQAFLKRLREDATGIIDDMGDIEGLFPMNAQVNTRPKTSSAQPVSDGSSAK